MKPQAHQCWTLCQQLSGMRIKVGGWWSSYQGVLMVEKGVKIYKKMSASITTRMRCNVHLLPTGTLTAHHRAHQSTPLCSPPDLCIFCSYKGRHMWVRYQTDVWVLLGKESPRSMDFFMGKLVLHRLLEAMGSSLLPRYTCTQDNNDSREPVSISSHDSIILYSHSDWLVTNQERLLASFS